MRSPASKQPGSILRDSNGRTSLSTLPPEILLEIVSYAPTAKYLRNLALTCHSLQRAVNEEGWRSFTLNNFPSIQTPPYWKDAAHALTTLSRNLDRRAFMASHMTPSGLVHMLPDGTTQTRWERPRGQTMGYQPVIDSYEIILDNWRSRKEVVAWGAGAELIVNRAERDASLRRWENSPSVSSVPLDPGLAEHEWIVYKDPEHAEGRDDITSVNLLPPHTIDGQEEGVEHIVVGRASNDLTHLALAPGNVECVKKTFRTGGTSVRCADLNTSTGLLAASLGDDRAVLYSLNDSGRMVQPTSQAANISANEKTCRAWATKFVSNSKIAISRGPSKSLVQVYEVRQDGLSASPIRSFSSQRGQYAPVTSAYPIVPVSDSATDKDSTGNLFLSGGYDSLIRLHDLRSPMDYAMVLSDPADISAIFSLAMIGRERIVAGGSTHALLKFFDIRMAGGRVYHYEQAISPRRTTDVSNAVRWDAQDVSKPQGSGWNLFGLSNSHSHSNRQSSSPVYSLSRPSSGSSTLYAGMENTVVNLNFTSPTDNHPDPKFDNSLYRTKYGLVDIAQTWDSQKSKDLIMYEQSSKGDLRLLHQRKIRSLSRQDEALQGYDLRWTTQSTWRPNKGRRR